MAKNCKLNAESSPRLHLLDQLHGLRSWLDQEGGGSYRGSQIEKWLFHSRVEAFGEMTNLPAPLRQSLSQSYSIWTTRVEQHDVAGDGTEKLLLQMDDGGRIECVLLREAQRRTICISSQIGCAMGCVFCASGLDGVDRNLTTGEMVEQMLRLQRLLPENERLSHIVVMGMGEPLANLDNVLSALQVASDSARLGISPRRITISTVGLPPAMDRLAKTNPRYQLAVSLHAANDKLRSRLVPVNAKSGLANVMAAADRYFEASGRRLTFEYVLLAGINDSADDARQLAARLKGRPALLNVIPYNPVAGLPYRTPSNRSIESFRRILEDANINVKFRQRKGDQIDAACGQLRRNRVSVVQLESPS